MKSKLLIGWLLFVTSTLSAQCFEKVFAGYQHYIAISQDGTLWAWGRNNNAQLGDGTKQDRATPVQISTQTDWAHISAGDNHTIAVKEDGTLWAWGNNHYGQIGTDTQGSYIVVPTQIGTDTNWKEAAAGYWGSMAIKTDGSLWSWGSNAYGYLGNGQATTYLTATPEQVGTQTDWKSIAGRHRHCVAIKNNGTLWAWGYNNFGQLGVGSQGTDIHTPVQIGNANDWKWIENGEEFSYALKNNNTLWVWGHGGALGIIATQPTQIGTHSDWKYVAIDAWYSFRKAALLIKQNGTLWAWGSDADERLGNGSQQGDYDMPTQISVATDWVSAAIGYKEANAIKADGSFWVWGETRLIGDGSVDIPIPTLYDCTPLMAVSEANILSDLQIYPNPTKEIVNFSHAIDGELFDTTGKKVLTINNTLSVNVSTLPKGIYILVTVDGIRKKLIIQ